MLTVRMVLGTLSILLLCGCGGTQTTQSMRVKKKSEPDRRRVGERIATAYSGPKIRVAVGEFKDFDRAKKFFKKMGWPKLGPGISGQIMTALVQTGRVAVLERQQIRKVIGNLQLEKESDISQYFNQKTTAKTGELLGAQAVLVGEITQFEPNVSGGSAGLSVPMLGGLSYHEDKAVVGMDVRLVHQETGKILVAASGKASISSKKFGGEAQYKGIKVGGGGWNRTPLGDATRVAAQRAIRVLIKSLKEIRWEGKIVKVSGKKKVFIQAGDDLNLKRGDRFQVYHRGEAIIGPDGNVIGYDETKGGIVTLKIIQSKLSIGVVKGKKPKAGDVVRLLGQ
ncbi:MAG: CsgG/HfaB family protein [Myxococcota bacterium]|nr:CsgG/HfaB family protein [Myxococcota bacterium]